MLKPQPRNQGIRMLNTQAPAMPIQRGPSAHSAFARVLCRMCICSRATRTRVASSLLESSNEQFVHSVSPPLEHCAMSAEPDDIVAELCAMAAESGALAAEPCAVAPEPGAIAAETNSMGAERGGDSVGSRRYSSLAQCAQSLGTRLCGSTAAELAAEPGAMCSSEDGKSTVAF